MKNKVQNIQNFDEVIANEINTFCLRKNLKLIIL